MRSACETGWSTSISTSITRSCGRRSPRTSQPFCRCFSLWSQGAETFAPLLFVGQDGVAHQGVDLAGPAAATEHAVMAHPGLHIVFFAIRSQAAAEIVRGHRLPDGADVVALALDSEQRGAADRLGANAPVTPPQLALGQQMVLKHALHRLEVELGGEVEHGKVLVVEIPDGARLRFVAFGP